MANKIKLARGTKSRIESIKNTLVSNELVYSTDTGELGVKKADGNIEYFMNATKITNLLNNLETSVDVVESMTYLNLKGLVDNSNLQVGKWYEITDYYATVKSELESDVKINSTYAKYKIILQALSKNKLSEKGYVSESNDDSLVGGGKVEVGDVVYYDINNTRWSNPNGKGVVYRYIDKYNNDIPFDFKNISFRWMPKGTIDGFYYLFSDEYGNETSSGGTYGKNVYNNYIVNETNTLYKNIFMGDTYDNIIGSGSYDNIVKGTFNSNNIKELFRENYINSSFFGNNVGRSFRDNTINSGWIDNTVGANFKNNTVNSFTNNTIANDFMLNEIGYNFNNNLIGNSFSNNNIGRNFTDNEVGNSFQRNIIGDYVSRNYFANGVMYIDLDGSDVSWSYVTGLIFENDFRGNSTGNKLNLNASGTLITAGNTYNVYLKKTASNKWFMERVNNDGERVVKIRNVNEGSWTEVSLGSGGEGIPDAPSDGKLYGRKNAGWEEVVTYTKGEIDTMIGDIESALDAILGV